MDDTRSYKSRTHAILSFTVGCMFVSPAWFIAFSLGMPTEPKYLGNFYHYNRTFDHIEFLSIALLVGVISLAVYLISTSAERSLRYRVVLSAVCMLAWLFVIDGLRRNFFTQFSLSNILQFLQVNYLGVGIAALGFMILVTLFRRHLFRISRMSVFLVFPVALIFFLNSMYAVWILSGSGFGYVAYDRSLAPIQSQENKPSGTRTIVLIFDDWDHALTFEKRDPTVKMPNLDSLKPVVFQAYNAQRFGGSTIKAVPRFLTGQNIVESEASLRGDLLLMFGNETRKMLSETRTIYNVAYEAGMTTGYGGIGYHPYCILLHNVISKCSGGSYDPTRVTKNILSQIPYVIKLILPAGSKIFGRSSPIPQHANGDVGSFLMSKDAVINAVADPQIDFMFGHLLMPHPPFIFDRKTRQFTDTSWEPVRYFDQLELLDLTIGEIISSLKKADLWDGTNLIFLSDHPSTYAHGYTDPSDNRIPVLIKLAGQSNRVEYQPKFDAIQLFELFPLIFSGKIKSTNDLARYFDSLH